MKRYSWRRPLSATFLLLVFVLLTTAVSGAQEPVQPQPQTWTAGKTSVSDLPPNEFLSMLGVDLDLMAQEARLSATARQSAPQRAYAFPAQFDLRDVDGADLTTPIRNQLGCGSCVSFGFNAAIESRLDVQSGNPLLNTDLSEGHLHFCGHGESCTGWYVDAALNVARDSGIVDEACQPYDSDARSCDPCPNWSAHLTKIAGYRKIYDPDAAKEALSTNGALVATMSTYTDFRSYVSGIYRHTYGDLLGGHAVAIVGYNDAEEYWIAKNSWGRNWGEDGWFRIAYGEVGIDDVFWSPLLRPADDIYVSSNRTSSAGGLTYASADIVRRDALGQWEMVFDASDLGIPETADLHAFTFLSDGSLLMTFDSEVDLPGMAQPATPWDVVHFIPKSFGSATTGKFAACPLDGFGQLSASGEEIDAMHFDGSSLYLSTAGSHFIDQGVFSIEGSRNQILSFLPDTAICMAGGSWDFILGDGSAIPGLDAENIKALSIDRDLNLTVGLNDAFTIMGVSGFQKDILLLARDSAMGDVSGANIYWHGPDHGYDVAIDGLYVGQAPRFSIPEISGTVTAEDSATPLQGIVVEACTPDYRCGYATTEANGLYRIVELTSGSYTLHFTDETGRYLPEYYDNAGTAEDATPVIAVAGETTQVDVALTPAGSIAGLVLGHDGAPLAEALVTAYGISYWGWSEIASAWTDVNGQYNLGGLPAGEYRLGFTDFSGEHLPEYYDDAPDLESATSLSVEHGATTTADARLARSGRIAGTVAAQGGAPLQDISVSVYRLEEDSWNEAANDYTAADGTYEVKGLEDGDYRLGFYDYNQVYAAEYFQDKLDVWSAADIHVDSGATIVIDERLVLAGSLTGKVTADRSGAAIDSASIYAFQWSNGEWRDTAWGYTEADGRYRIGGLQPTAYRLQFNDNERFYVSEFYADAADVASATDVHIYAGRTSTINAGLAEGGRISGIVSAATDGPLPSITITAYQHSGGQWLESARGWSAEDGVYEVTGLAAGDYRVGFTDSAYLHQPQFYNGAPELSQADDVAISLGVLTSGINATLTPYPEPANDDFDSPTVIGSLPFFELQLPTVGASKVSDDPLLPCGPQDSQGEDTVWYRLDPEQDLTISATTQGSSFDTVLAIWRGARGSLVEVACNDDGDESYYDDLTSRLEDVALQGGETYLIEVAGYGDSGLLRLAVEPRTDSPFGACESWTGSSASVTVPAGVDVQGALSMQPGDELALTNADGSFCAGRGLWTGESLDMIAWGDDTRTSRKDGFATGEAFTWAFWDVSDAELHRPVAVTYSDGDGTFAAGSRHTVQSLEIVPQPNHAPQAVSESYTLFAAQTLVAPAPGVLDNDSDPDGDRLKAMLHTDVQHGVLLLAADGSFSYRPEDGFTGTDSFRYRASDGEMTCAPVMVTLTVRPRTVLLPLIYRG